MIMPLFKRGIMMLLTLALASLLLFSLACGDDDDDDGGDDGGAETPEATTPADDGDDDDGNGGGKQEAEVIMGDNFFDPDTLTVAAGSTITITLPNEGAAIHNMRIAGADNEYDTEDDAVSDPEIVNGGDTATLDWTAPDEPGEIDFKCDFHPTDMVGTITVE